MKLHVLAIARLVDALSDHPIDIAEQLVADAGDPVADDQIERRPAQRHEIVLIRLVRRDDRKKLVGVQTKIQPADVLQDLVDGLGKDCALAGIYPSRADFVGDF